MIDRKPQPAGLLDPLRWARSGGADPGASRTGETVRGKHRTGALRRRQLIRFLQGAALLALSMGMPDRAMADCSPQRPSSGGTVRCTGTDTDGFEISISNLSVLVDEGAIVSNRDRGRSTDDGLRLKDGNFTVINRGTVIGQDGLFIRGSDSFIENFGTFSSFETSSGFFGINHGNETGVPVVTGSTVINRESGLIRGYGGGLRLLVPGSIVNFGNIIGFGPDGTGVVLGATIQLENSGLIQGVGGRGLLIRGGAEQALATNLETGTIRSINSTAVQVDSARVTLINHGLIESGDDGIRIGGSGDRADEVIVENTGRIVGSGSDDGIRVRNGTGVRITNSGLVTDFARGVRLQGVGTIFRNLNLDPLNDAEVRGVVDGARIDGTGNSIENEGLIEGGETGIRISGGAADNAILNFGTIAGGTYGILVEDGASGTTITNDGGTITGGTAIEGGDGDETVLNLADSTIDGNVLLRDGNDVFDNAGTVNGSIDLGAGDDRFVDNGGTLTGSVRGGDGADTYEIDNATIEDFSFVADLGLLSFERASLGENATATIAGPDEGIDLFLDLEIAGTLNQSVPIGLGDGNEISVADGGTWEVSADIFALGDNPGGIVNRGSFSVSRRPDNPNGSANITPIEISVPFVNEGGIVRVRAPNTIFARGIASNGGTLDGFVGIAQTIPFFIVGSDSDFAEPAESHFTGNVTIDTLTFTGGNHDVFLAEDATLNIKTLTLFENRSFTGGANSTVIVTEGARVSFTGTTFLSAGEFFNAGVTRITANSRFSVAETFLSDGVLEISDSDISGTFVVEEISPGGRDPRLVVENVFLGSRTGVSPLDEHTSIRSTGAPVTLVGTIAGNVDLAAPAPANDGRIFIRNIGGELSAGEAEVFVNYQHEGGLIAGIVTFHRGGSFTGNGEGNLLINRETDASVTQITFQSGAFELFSNVIGQGGGILLGGERGSRLSVLGDARLAVTDNAWIVDLGLPAGIAGGFDPLAAPADGLVLNSGTAGIDVTGSILNRGNFYWLAGELTTQEIVNSGTFFVSSVNQGPRTIGFDIVGPGDLAIAGAVNLSAGVDLRAATLAIDGVIGSDGFGDAPTVSAQTFVAGSGSDSEILVTTVGMRSAEDGRIDFAVGSSGRLTFSEFLVDDGDALVPLTADGELHNIMVDIDGDPASRQSVLRLPGGENVTLLADSEIAVRNGQFAPATNSSGPLEVRNTSLRFDDIDTLRWGGDFELTEQSSMRLSNSEGMVVGDLLVDSASLLLADASALSIQNSARLSDGGFLLVGPGSTLEVLDELQVDGGLIAPSTAVINGVATVGELDINLFARLLGTGTINGQIIRNNGLVSPGASPGILTFNADYEQSETGILGIEIGGTQAGSEYDQLIVNGTATFLSGARIEITFLDLDGDGQVFEPAAGDSFDFLMANSIVLPDGTDFDDLLTFTNLPAGARFRTSLITVDGMTLLSLLAQLGLDPDFVLGLSPQLQATGNFVNRLLLGDTPIPQASEDTLLEIVDLDEAAIPAALNALTPEAYASGAASFGTETSRAVSAVFSDRLDRSFEPMERAGLQFWVQGIGRFSSNEGAIDLGVSGFDTDLYGLVFGADAGIGPGTHVGGMIGYVDGNQDFEMLPARNGFDSMIYGLYAFHRTDRLTLGVAASYAPGELATRRSISAGAVEGTFTGDSDLDILTLHGEARYVVYRSNGFEIEPIVGFTYTAIDRNPVSEMGVPGLNLEVEGRQFESLVSDLGIRLERTWQTNNVAISIDVEGAWRYDFENDSHLAVARLAGIDFDSFTVAGAPTDRSTARLSTGLSAEWRNGLSVFAAYEGIFGGDSESHSARVGLGWAF